MYSKDQILEGIRDTDKILDEAKRFKYRIPKKIFQRYYPNKSESGIDIPSADWDNLLIIDACRYDIYESMGPIEGELSSVQSKGSMTIEWMKNNFDGGEFDDIVFISASPHIAHIDAKFADIWHVWETDWDNDLGTVRPEYVVKRTIQAANEYPNKRVLSMFLQPHYPFIGKDGSQINHSKIRGGGLKKDDTDVQNVWNRLGKGDIDKKTVLHGYKENLELVRDHLKGLLDELEGKTVISSDHGNGLGEWQLYGHPKNVHISELVTVPWEIIMTGNRKKIEPASTLQNTTSYRETKNRLAALGYIN